MKDRQNWALPHPFKFVVVVVVLMLVCIAELLTAPRGCTQQKNQQQGSMPGMDMGDDSDLRTMGPSMAAMAGHMYITPARPKQAGDEEKAKAVVATVKSIIERYKDYRKALADGYAIANPKLKQPQYHFMNQANTREADLHFDPSKPTALLYRRTPMQEYKLEGVMFTANPDATEDELNQRIPLSVARWHRHINFCEAPEDRAKDYQARSPQVRHVRLHKHERSLRGRTRYLSSVRVHLDDSHFSVRTRLQRRFLDE